MRKTSEQKEEAAVKKSVNTTVNRIAEGGADEALAPFVGALFRAISGADERQTVIVCFGTTAISGDALGPAVGRLLRDKYKVSAFVYGTDEHTVNGKNMGEWLEFIKSVHEGALFIAVDASLGGGDKVGQIGYHLGAALNRLVFNLGNADGEQDGNREAENQGIKGEQKGIPH